MEVAIIGYASCAYHASAVQSAKEAGIKARITTVADRAAFKQFLTSLNTVHQTSPIVFELAADTADTADAAECALLGQATLIGGCDDLQRRLGTMTSAEKQRLERQFDTSSRTPEEIASFFHATQREHRFVVWVLWRGAW